MLRKPLQASQTRNIPSSCSLLCHSDANSFPLKNLFLGSSLFSTSRFRLQNLGPSLFTRGFRSTTPVRGRTKESEATKQRRRIKELEKETEKEKGQKKKKEETDKEITVESPSEQSTTENETPKIESNQDMGLKASALCREGKFSEAATAVREHISRLESADKKPSADIIAEADFLLFEVLNLTENSAESVPILEKIINAPTENLGIEEKSSLKKYKKLALQNLSDVYASSEKYEESRKIARQLYESALQEQASDTITAGTLSLAAISQAQIPNADPNEVEKMFLLSITKLQALGYHFSQEELFNSTQALFSFYTEHRMFAQIKELADRILAEQEKHKFVIDRASALALNHLGDVALEKSRDFQKAQELYSKALTQLVLLDGKASEWTKNAQKKQEEVAEAALKPSKSIKDEWRRKEEEEELKTSIRYSEAAQQNVRRELMNTHFRLAEVMKLRKQSLREIENHYVSAIDIAAELEAKTGEHAYTDTKLKLFDNLAIFYAHTQQKDKMKETNRLREEATKVSKENANKGQSIDKLLTSAALIRHGRRNGRPLEKLTKNLTTNTTEPAPLSSNVSSPSVTTSSSSPTPTVEPNPLAFDSPEEFLRKFQLAMASQDFPQIFKLQKAVEAKVQAGGDFQDEYFFSTLAIGDYNARQSPDEAAVLYKKAGKILEELKAKKWTPPAVGKGVQVVQLVHGEDWKEEYQKRKLELQIRLASLEASSGQLRQAISRATELLAETESILGKEREELVPVLHLLMEFNKLKNNMYDAQMYQTRMLTLMRKLDLDPSHYFGSLQPHFT